jgi:hypothetical protein
MHWLQGYELVKTSSGLLSVPGLILAVLDQLPNILLRLSHNIHGGLMTDFLDENIHAYIHLGGNCCCCWKYYILMAVSTAVGTLLEVQAKLTSARWFPRSWGNPVRLKPSYNSLINQTKFQPAHNSSSFINCIQVTRDADFSILRA